MKKASKRGFLVLIGVMLAAALTGCAGTDSEEILAETQIENVDLSRVKDGIFEGKHKAGLVSAEVVVEVAAHQIKGIEISKHDNWRGGKAEAITEGIITAQSLDVDSVSGATVSSQVILKAVENALRAGF